MPLLLASGSLPTGRISLAPLDADVEKRKKAPWFPLDE
jgi:hypothetical protein